MLVMMATQARFFVAPTRGRFWRASYWCNYFRSVPEARVWLSKIL